MEVYERIRALRKSMKMSMDAFGARLGVSRDVINNIEHNRLARPDQKISLIKLMCKEFSVNEEWILNGEGEMFVEQDRNDEINQFINKALQDKPESFKLRLISALSRLKDDDWEVLERFAADLVGKADGSTAPASVSFFEMPDEEAHAELSRQMRDEKERAEKSQASQNTNSRGERLA